MIYRRMLALSQLSSYTSASTMSQRIKTPSLNKAKCLPVPDLPFPDLPPIPEEDIVLVATTSYITHDTRDMLKFLRGEVIKLHPAPCESPEGWLFGSTERRPRRSGWFPASYVKEAPRFGT